MTINIKEIGVSGIASDSRNVQEGHLFAAIDGVDINGEQFIEGAIANGAKAILLNKDSDVEFPEEILRIESKNPRRDLALYAAEFYTPQPQNIIAITGTDGKTSTAEFVRQIWSFLGIKSASVGTLGVSCDYIADTQEFPNTTPDPVIFHHSMQELAKHGINNIAVEASSHGLDQHRLDGAKIKAAAFTTFGHDHGDYHGSVENYFAAKSRLFTDLLPSGATAIFNVDDKVIAEFADKIARDDLKIETFGVSGGNYRIISASPTVEGLSADIEIYKHKWSGVIPLYGGFQLMNVMAAIALVIESDKNIESESTRYIERIFSNLSNLKGINGRMEEVSTNSSGAKVFIDYAHTPDALAKLLEALRLHTKNKLHVVFGCGGDRDKAKRPKMGAVADSLADNVIVTDDNPRSEDATVIRSEILAACPSATEIADRKEAISVAISKLKAGDILVVAGKGHESGQSVGNKIIPHNDKDIILNIIGALS